MHYVNVGTEDRKLLLFGCYNPSVSELMEAAKKEFPDTPLNQLWVWNNRDGLYLADRQYPDPNKRYPHLLK